MKHTITVLVTDDSIEVVTTHHANFAAAVACLRANFDADGAWADVPDDKAAEIIASSQGILVTIDTIEVEIPAPDCPIDPIYIESAISDIDDDQVHEVIEAMDQQTIFAALDAAFEPHAKAFAFLRAQVVEDAIAALTENAEAILDARR